MNNIITVPSTIHPSFSADPPPERLPLLWQRREYLDAPACGSRTTSSNVLRGTTSGLDRGPDDGDW